MSRKWGHRLMALATFLMILGIFTPFPKPIAGITYLIAFILEGPSIITPDTPKDENWEEP